MNPGRAVTLVGMTLGMAVGCGQTPPGPTDTGSRQAAADFYAALIKKEWANAHATLDADSQKKFSPEQFAILAESYHGQLGFQPQEVQVRACEERGAEATAHVTITGRAGKQTSRYRDGVLVRREGDLWRVVLPERFGNPK